MGESREDLGYVASDPEVNSRIRAHFKRQGLDYVILEKAREVAFRDFPAFGPHESLGVREIKRRLSEIKQIGYKLEPYSHMTKGQVWNYLLKVRRDLSDAARYR